MRDPCIYKKLYFTEKLITSTGHTSNNLEKTNPSEIERNYNIRKQQTRFMRCNNSRAPLHQLVIISGILLSVRTKYSQKARIMKKSNTLSMHGEKFYQLNAETTTAVAPTKYSGKTNPSEIERTYNIRKQQTRFY